MKLQDSKRAKDSRGKDKEEVRLGWGGGGVINNRSESREKSKICKEGEKQQKGAV